MAAEIHEITRSADDHGVTDITAVFPWGSEDVTLKQDPVCRDRAVERCMRSLKIGDRIQVKGMMTISHFIDPQARRAFRLNLIIDHIRDEEDVDERTEESVRDPHLSEEGKEPRGNSRKRRRTSTSSTNRQRFRKDRVVAPKGLNRDSRHQENVHRDRSHAPPHEYNEDQVQETRESKYNRLFLELPGTKEPKQVKNEHICHPFCSH